MTRLPRRTVRFRLTLLYGGLFLLAGVAVLTLTYVLVVHATAPRAVVVRDVHGTEQVTSVDATKAAAPSGTGFGDQVRQLRDQAVRQHDADLHQLLVQSTVALGAAAVLAFAAGWFVAGRVLRPLRAMTTTTQRISQHNLHERLSLTGPRDEVKDLADTIDGLLARLQAAFDVQHRFVANVSHELRTPLTWQRALLEVSLTDPDATGDTLRDTMAELLTSGQDQERLIEALLTLATSERGLDRRDPVDLADLTHDVLRQRAGQPAGAAPELVTDLAEAPAAGNADLLKRLIANLVDNAYRHNTAGGRVDVRTGVRDGQAVLTVANTGPVIAAAEITRLLEPFQRLAGERTSHPDGHGLGLSIVAAVATAHDARLTVQPRPGGGLDVELTFPGPHRSPVVRETGATMWA
ncbi:MAG TPA: HAMP domain-containing sensor histidine kinase [Pseudonocardiaceae bacterium]|nr:HAMP domain-containing sensor histidine kinase [Pseudonocardiaceae bacterium]